MSHCSSYSTTVDDYTTHIVDWVEDSGYVLGGVSIKHSSNVVAVVD